MTGSKPLLVLALGDAEMPTLWCLGDAAEPQWRQAGVLLSPTGLPIDASQCRVLVCVPGQSVTLQEVLFTGPSRAATPLALAYQCEDKVLEEVEQLHWVILGRQEEKYALAGYRHADMQRWLSQLADWGITPDRFLPDTLCGPIDESHFYRWQGRLLCRTSPWSGYSLPSHWPLPTADATVRDAVPLSPCDVLWNRARGEANTSVSLLQGKYKALPRWQRNPFWRHWPAVAGVTLMLGALAAGGLQYRYQTGQTIQLRDALYQRLFVGQPIAPDPLEKSAVYIRALQEEKSPRHFFDLAAQAQQALTGIPEHRVIGLAFEADKSVLTLRLQGAALQPFTKINDQGNRLELRVDPGNRQGTLTLRENL
ncbi:general secretion pathway protein GspL [Serratia proteamaculans]|uniref:type II secretion system protein GspL n=1 Tax=Serratia proteamaculans TaxID=28151 RepID=UPI001075E81D|nr:type II secretion system protein GspL [Serratia proteamaculans]TFZ48866.1 general secretion pathway protein GspL [Serratia proteamaculans]